MLGVVLCGGRSTRMGTDKGLIHTSPGTFAQAAVQKLSSLGLPVIISVNTDQYDTYRSFFTDSALLKDRSSLSIKGPLLGVLSAHLNRPDEDLFILACDMPLMESFLLKELTEAYSQNPSKGAFVFTTKGEPEPLCGIYTARMLASFLNLHNKGHLNKHSMKYLLEHSDVLAIPAPAVYEKYFTNVNTHAALNGL
jgi:molybdopterin-guanine dinucleotide biosynthesis protein A